MADEDLAGRSARLTFTVEESDLAPALGSGDVPVLATPRMIAWLEAASVAAVAEALPAGVTSVGVAVEIDHVAASPAGAVITVSATVRGVRSKTLIFDCEAIAESGEPAVIGHGTISRAMVDRERFMSRLRR